MAELKTENSEQESSGPRRVGRPRKKSKEDGKQRRANGVATRLRIIETARGMFATGGYEATSLRQISGAVGIDVATLKYHFASKSSLFSEVYRLGHEALIRSLRPVMEGFKEAQTREALRVAIEDLVIALHDFISDEFPFVHMFLFRLLEGSDITITLEDALQDIATEMFDDIFEGLKQRDLIRDVDQRAVLNLLLSSFTTWFVIAEARPTWIQDPSPLEQDGRYRSEAFFADMLERLLLD